jgi:hypothetical protein
VSAHTEGVDGFASYIRHGGLWAIAMGLGAGMALAPAIAFAEPPQPGTPAGHADEPMPLNGRYLLNRALDRQTFNGSPAPAIPFTSEVSFATTCDESRCIARSSLVAQNQPVDFGWTGTQWRSEQHFGWTCEGQTAPATVTYTLTPNSNGTLSGDRTAVVDSPGCGTPRGPGVVFSPLTGVPV